MLPGVFKKYSPIKSSFYDDDALHAEGLRDAPGLHRQPRLYTWLVVYLDISAG